MKPDTIGIDLFLITTMFWIIVYMVCIVRISKFIVPRYEKETNLLEFIFFQRHMTFTRYLPVYQSTAIYCGHLSIFIWGWRLYRNRKVFRDIKDPKEILGVFSHDEINAVKRQGLVALIAFIHLIIFGVIRVFHSDLLPQ